MGVVKVNLEPPLIPLIKINHNDKSENGYVKVKLRRYLTSPRSDLYEFEMALFDNGQPEDFLLFVCNFNMTMEESEMTGKDVKVQYLHRLVRGEALRQFDLLSSDVENTNPLTVEAII